MGFKEKTGVSEKTNPTFSLMMGKMDSNSGITLCPPLTSLKKAKSSSSLSNSLNLKEMAFLTMVFFPITNSALFSTKVLLIYWHYKDPTFSKVTAII